MDSILARPQVNGARAKGVLHSALHVFRQIGAPLEHLRGRPPIRPLAFATDCFRAGPGETLPTYPDPVLDRLPITQHVVETALGCRNYHGAPSIFAVPPNHDLPRYGLHAKSVEKVGHWSAVKRAIGCKGWRSA